SRSATIPRAPRNGILSNTVCSARSAKIGRAPEELSNGPQLHSHHHDFDGTEGACSSAAQEIRKRRKDIGAENATPCAVQAHDATEVELHAAANVKLFLRSS